MYENVGKCMKMYENVGKCRKMYGNKGNITLLNHTPKFTKRKIELI